MVDQPKQAQDGYLLSCVTVHDCVGVGIGGPINGNPNVDFVDEAAFNPITPQGATHGAPDSEISEDPDSHDNVIAFACATVSVCVIGHADGSSVEFDPGHVRRKARTKQVDGAPNVRTGESSLSALTCPAAQECVSIDDSGYETTFDPVTGARAVTSRIDASAESEAGLGAVACPQVSQCTVLDSDGELTFNPRSPNRQAPVQLIAVNPANVLGDLACPSTRQCAATDSDGQVVSFNPKSGVAGAPIPVLGGTADSAIACVSGVRCLILGDSGREVLDGNPASTRPWTAEPIAIKARKGGFVNITCPSRKECVASGPGGLAIGLPRE